jgi:transketolase
MKKIITNDSDELARRIRIQSLQMVHRARASHIGSALSICDIIAVLYSQILQFNTNLPSSPDRDRFILSKGHACVAVYAALAEIGFFPIENLIHYGQDHSVLMNHISHKVPGVEFSTGSLGHGLPFGTGKALAAKRLKHEWYTYVLLGDGELGEGSNWEAMMFAAHHQLDNLVAIIDYNKLQSLTTVDQTLRIEPLVDKVRAFGWAVQEVDGHDHAQLTQSLGYRPREINKPLFLIAHTTKGKGVSFMENKVEWHYKSPSTDQLKQALEELNCYA